MYEGTRKAFKRYEEMLEDLGAEEENLADTHPTSLDHLLWMCRECLRTLESMPIDKCSRWLGFVQGILAAYEIISVAEERAVTRPWFTGQH